MSNYAEIEACLAEARRLRSEAVGGYLVAGWRAIKRGFMAIPALFDARKARPPRGRAGGHDHLHGGLSY